MHVRSADWAGCGWITIPRPFFFFLFPTPSQDLKFQMSHYSSWMVLCFQLWSYSFPSYVDSPIPIRMLLFLVRASQGFPNFLPSLPMISTLVILKLVLPKFRSRRILSSSIAIVARGSRPFPPPTIDKSNLDFFFSYALFCFPPSSKPGSATIYRSAAWSFYQMRVRTSDPTGWEVTLILGSRLACDGGSMDKTSDLDQMGFPAHSPTADNPADWMEQRTVMEGAWLS